MKKKSRDRRKLKRAQESYRKVLNRTNGYSKELLLADLRLKYVARWYYSLHPKPLRKIRLIYGNSKTK